MSVLQLALRSLVHYLKSNLVLALGVAAAAAVLTGALLVGDSMRNSLKELALDRLGLIDELIVADGFFRAELAKELRATETFQAKYDIAEPAIVFPNGSVEARGDSADNSMPNFARASKVNVFGISETFWTLAGTELSSVPSIADSNVIINQALADKLGIADKSQFTLTLRIPKPTQLPSDSSLGKKEGLIERLVDLNVAAIIPNKSIGRFGFHVSQLDSPNIFVPFPLVDEALRRSALSYKSGPQANAVFLSRKSSAESDVFDPDFLLSAMLPTLGDLGLAIKEVSQLKADSDEFAYRYYSLSSDRLVLSDPIADAIRKTCPTAVEVFTYLANDIRIESSESGIPFSMVSALEVGPNFDLRDVDGNPIPKLDRSDIVLNEWAANDLNAKVDQGVELVYFEPESQHQNQQERTADFRVAAIAKLAEPDTQFRVRRNKITRPRFLRQSPTLANDPDLTPEVPGLTDAASIELWDLPFDTADRIRTQDDDYWNHHRTTPKAFVAPERAKALWGSRFGTVTSFRIPKSAGKLEDVESKILSELRSNALPSIFNIIPIKQQALDASTGATPFDVLFLALSMFVIASALILVALLFRLALKRRAAGLGTLLATGLTRSQVSRTMLIEMLAVNAIGVLLGLALGISYAAIVIFGLKTWWLGAIAQPVIDLHITARALAIGAISALVICFLTIAMSIRGTRKIYVQQMLAGELTSTSHVAMQQSQWHVRWIGLLLVGAIGLSIVASFLGGEPQAGAFMGAGFLVLAAGLFAIYNYLRSADSNPRLDMSVNRLAFIAAKRNPLRSTLTIGLVAVASFLIIAVSSFRLSPSEEGTAGFDLIATSEQPIFETLTDRSELEFESFSIRVKSGEDASCNNLYQSSQPRVIGLPESFVNSFNKLGNSFRWASTSTSPTGVSYDNPWRMLNDKYPDGAIPVVIDKNTANYSLKIFAVGTDYKVQFDSGEAVTFRVVGMLENSILQGSLIISEQNFIQQFPTIYGHQQFLIRDVSGKASGDQLAENANLIATELEKRFGDQGFDSESANDVLAKFQQVQNTYISTFQSLGALGLLLGTFGLAVVQIRSVLERQKELAVLRSVGFSRSKLSKLVLMEHAWLLVLGLMIGVAAALVTTLPHYAIGGASVPWIALTQLFVAILSFGLFATWIASRLIAKLPLIESLRVG